MKLTRKISTLAVGTMVMLLGAIQAQSAVVRLDPDDPNNALGIDNLVLGGFYYNVTFKSDLSINVHDYVLPLELFGDVLHPIALEVTGAVNDVLNTEPGVRTVGGTGGFEKGPHNFAFAEDRGTELWYTAATVGEYSDGVGWIIGDGDIAAPDGSRPGYDLILRDLEVVNWALLESVGPVPIPAAVWLFGSGLLGLIGVARRKKTV
jgi:hypothetical protein